jgi:hypothetical protein
LFTLALCPKINWKYDIGDVQLPSIESRYVHLNNKRMVGILSLYEGKSPFC